MMSRWLRTASAVDALNRRIAAVVAWLTLAMVLIGAFNAIARQSDRHLGTALSSNAYLELQWYLFSLVFLLGAPYALRIGSHVRVDVLYCGHTERAKAWIDLCSMLLFVLPFCVFAVWISYDFAADSIRDLEMSNDPGGLPRWILKPFVPIAFVLLALQGFSELVKRIALLRGAPASVCGLTEPTHESEGGTV